jgi:hypothetical protein
MDPVGRGWVGARWSLVVTLGVAACGLAEPPVPATPPMPPLTADAGEPPLAAGHWFDATSSCTGTEPAGFLGLVSGYSFRFQLHVVPGQLPPVVDLRLDEGTRRSFSRLETVLEGGGSGTRLVVHRGQTLRGEPRVLAWAGADRRFHFPGERCEEEQSGSQRGGGSGSGPAPEPAVPEPQPASLVAPAPRVLVAGGRPLAWWTERLSSLRKDGPLELYRLAQQRAKAAGLTVTEGPNASVTVAEQKAP